MLHGDVHRAFPHITAAPPLQTAHLRHKSDILVLFFADVAAFPMPDTGLAVYLETVRAHQLIFAARCFHQRIGRYLRRNSIAVIRLAA